MHEKLCEQLQTTIKKTKQDFANFRDVPKSHAELLQEKGYLELNMNILRKQLNIIKGW